MIYNKVMVENNGMMDRFMRVSIMRVRKMGKGNIVGLMEVSMKVNGPIIKSMVM